MVIGMTEPTLPRGGGASGGNLDRSGARVTKPSIDSKQFVTQIYLNLEELLKSGLEFLD